MELSSANVAIRPFELFELLELIERECDIVMAVLPPHYQYRQRECQSDGIRGIFQNDGNRKFTARVPNFETQSDFVMYDRKQRRATYGS